ncbi:hypothetical protein BDZ97DRAFT_1761992 [Flammula alnicola]|nr:hypothetical protein BDZ97DRAFT_1761992 [Flammula alnicola]
MNVLVCSRALLTIDLENHNQQPDPYYSPYSHDPAASLPSSPVSSPIATLAFKLSHSPSPFTLSYTPAPSIASLQSLVSGSGNQDRLHLASWFARRQEMGNIPISPESQPELQSGDRASPQPQDHVSRLPGEHVKTPLPWEGGDADEHYARGLQWKAYMAQMMAEEPYDDESQVCRIEEKYEEQTARRHRGDLDETIPQDMAPASTGSHPVLYPSTFTLSPGPPSASTSSLMPAQNGVLLAPSTSSIMPAQPAIDMSKQQALETASELAHQLEALHAVQIQMYVANLSWIGP